MKKIRYWEQEWLRVVILYHVVIEALFEEMTSEQRDMNWVAEWARACHTEARVWTAVRQEERKEGKHGSSGRSQAECARKVWGQGRVMDFIQNAMGTIGKVM
jgi:hypothetical protein